MEERGECSGSAKPSDEIWAKLVPSDSRYSDVEIRSDENVICSEISATLSNKHSWCKIVRNSDLCSATMENKSPNTILVDGAEVFNDGTVIIKDGSEITPGPDRQGFVSYRFHIMSSPEACQRQLKICVDVEHAKCSICLNIWHDVVTVAPCLHNFCNGCFSEWLRRSQEKRSTVLCPQCRAVVHFVGKNHFLRTIQEDMLKADSSLRRSHEEIALLDTYASVRSNLVIGSAKKNRKRANTPLDDQSDSTNHQCPQCVTEVGGFRCNQNTVHLQCQACGGMMPSRTASGVPQYCSGCDRPFCGPYWHALGAPRSGPYPVCSQDTLKPISEHTLSRIPLLAHEKNLHEQNITESCIRQMGRTLQDVISEWIAKLDNKEIDRTRMTLNHAEIITAGTFVCWFFQQMHQQEKIVGMDMHVGHNTVVKSTLVKGTMSAVQPEALMSDLM
ncbi:Zinc finger, RING-type [Sesbania bispinosa]|nr:Zinc finger, RING-type [Sesbania bispinosa]